MAKAKKIKKSELELAEAQYQQENAAQAAIQYQADERLIIREALRNKDYEKAAQLFEALAPKKKDANGNETNNAKGDWTQFQHAWGFLYLDADWNAAQYKALTPKLSASAKAKTKTATYAYAKDLYLQMNLARDAAGKFDLENEGSNFWIALVSPAVNGGDEGFLNKIKQGLKKDLTNKKQKNVVATAWAFQQFLRELQLPVANADLGIADDQAITH